MIGRPERGKMRTMESRYDSVEQSMPVHPVWKELDLDALLANYREVRTQVGTGIKIIASVKANAYGHGVVEIARALGGTDVYALATSSFADAVAMREAGVDTPIQMFASNLPEGAAELLRYDLMPTVYDMDGANAVSDAAREPVKVYIKVDSGLGRLGVPLAKAEAFIASVAALPNLQVEGVYSHLPYSDADGKAWADERLEGFNAFVERLVAGDIDIPVTQVLASTGVAGGVSDHCNTVCVGHLLYGGIAVAAADVVDLAPFRPVLKAIKARLIHVGHKEPGEVIGSGGSYMTKGKTTTGIVPVGQYDGYRRPASGKSATMLMQDKRGPGHRRQPRVHQPRPQRNPGPPGRRRGGGARRRRRQADLGRGDGRLAGGARARGAHVLRPAAALPLP